MLPLLNQNDLNVFNFQIYFIKKIINYFQISENGKLILHIPLETSKGDGGSNSSYAQELKKSFIKLINSLGYKINLKDIIIDKQWVGNTGEAPNDEQLASDYYEWHTTEGITIQGYVITNTDEHKNISFSKLQCEIIIGKQK